MAYFQSNLNYIIDTYCINKEKPELKCNGKCHLKIKIASVNSNDGNQLALTQLPEAFYPLYFQNGLNYPFLRLSEPKKYTVFYFQDHYGFLFNTKILRPPITCFS